MTTRTSEARFFYNFPPTAERNALTHLCYYGSRTNVVIGLPDFEHMLGTFEDRLKDLLELAAYIYCADRMVQRGNLTSADNKGWTRAFHHTIQVRDAAFWKRSEIVDLLRETLEFMSGDHHDFSIAEGHATPSGWLFEAGEALQEIEGPCTVAMFSGGLDSTTGIHELLCKSSNHVVLASHHSLRGRPASQKALVERLVCDFGPRLTWHRFVTHLTGDLRKLRRREETQRTRSFLYAAAGLAVSRAYGLSTFAFYENGITSINLPPAEHYQLARASRTTHPKVLSLLSQLFSEIIEDEFTIEEPFRLLTKTDVVQRLVADGGGKYLDNTISCSRTFDVARTEGASHCGRCSQCIDRRLALAAAGHFDLEPITTYKTDVAIQDPSPPDDTQTRAREERAMLVDYLRHANALLSASAASFEADWVAEIVDIEGTVKAFTGYEGCAALYDLHHRHGWQVADGVKQLCAHYWDAVWSNTYEQGSLIDIICRSEHLKESCRALATSLSERFQQTLPIAFRANKPKDEADLKDKAEALLAGDRVKFEREYPTVPFSIAMTTPDFSPREDTLYLEFKYIRGHNTPSKITKGISEAITKYSHARFILFVVYDPENLIADVRRFGRDYEELGPFMVSVVK